MQTLAPKFNTIIFFYAHTWNFSVGEDMDAFFIFKKQPVLDILNEKSKVTNIQKKNIFSRSYMLG